MMGVEETWKENQSPGLFGSTAASPAGPREREMGVDEIPETLAEPDSQRHSNGQWMEPQLERSKLSKSQGMPGSEQKNMDGQFGNYQALSSAASGHANMGAFSAGPVNANSFRTLPRKSDSQQTSMQLTGEYEGGPWAQGTGPKQLPEA